MSVALRVRIKSDSIRRPILADVREFRVSQLCARRSCSHRRATFFMLDLLAKSELVFSYPRRVELPYPWVEHIPFAFFLVDILRPKLLVELGSHTGNSYNAFCQAVELSGSNTKCNAVDTWQGDVHAGEYQSSIYEDLRSYQESTYPGFSTLLRMTFDEALPKFEDRSIDLLHIDGLHTYEAVKHDFETWLPKVAPGGVILMHDIAVREHDFGVWRLWEEIKTRFKTSEFPHGYGLGVVYIDGAREREHEELRALLSLQAAQRIFSSMGRAILRDQENIDLERGRNSLIEQNDEIRRAAAHRPQMVNPFDKSREMLGVPDLLFSQVSFDRGQGFEEDLTYRQNVLGPNVEFSCVLDEPINGARGVFVMPVNAPARLSSIKVAVVAPDGEIEILVGASTEGLVKVDGGILESTCDFPRMFFAESLPRLIKEIRISYRIDAIGRDLVGWLQAEMTEMRSDISRLSSKTEQLESSLGEVLGSCSWRFTAPIRTMRSWITSSVSSGIAGTQPGRVSPKS